MSAWLPALAILCLTGLVSSGAYAAGTAQPTNADFESGNVGAAPPGWTVSAHPAQADIVARIDGDKPYAGHGSGVLRVSGAPGGNATGILHQTIDAAPYRGKILLLHFAARTVEAGGAAKVWIRAEGPNGAFHPESLTHDEFPPNWRTFNLVLWVPADAERIAFGLTQKGNGQRGLDDVSFRIVDPSRVGYAPPRPLTREGLQNLHAFARLFGYVRFFHPSDQAASADWNRVAIAGVERVEGARGPAALVRTLRGLFLPLAPTLRIFQTGSPVPAASPALRAAPNATIVGWRHRGVFLGTSFAGTDGTYTSERVAITSPSPGQAFAADLGAGVSILLPTTLYRNASGTLPAARAGAAAIRPNKPPLFSPSALDRTTRLADVVLSWTVFENFYPYFAEEPADWPAVLDESLGEAATDRDAYDFFDTLSKMTAALRDGHAQVFMPAQRQLELPLYWEWIEDSVVVTLVAKDRPGGLAPGDIIDRIDGRPVAGEIARIEPTISAATPQWKMIKLLSILRRQRSDAPVAIDAHRAGDVPVVATIAPTAEPLAYENHYLLPVVGALQPGIWYVDLRRITQPALDGALKDLAAARGIVFDLRGYPSQAALSVLAHLSDKPVRSQQYNVPVFTMPDQIGVTYDPRGWQVTPLAPLFHGKFVFLTDGSAVSYAETIMGMVEDNHLGDIVGNVTAGTNGTINIIELPGDYTIDWSGMRVLKLDGSRFEGIGVHPTVTVVPAIADIRAGRDVVLDKATAIAAGTQ